MIFFYNAQGNAINVVPEPVYQGSNKANTIYVVAPFPSNVQVLAHFLLPNGEILQPVYAPNKNGLTLLDTLNINDSSVGVWGVQLTKVMTAYAGIVSVQFEFISYDQEITTKTVMFPVSKGVPPSVPLDTTAETTLQEILSYISVILETLDTVSRGTPLVSNETFVLDVTHESIVVGYNALLPLSSFDRTPVQGEKFWGICKTNDNYAYSFVAVVMSVDNENSVVEVEFTNVILLYDSDFYINVTNKLNKLIFDGNGDKFLTDDGEYKEIDIGLANYTKGLSFTVTSEEEKTCTVRNGTANSEEVVIPPYVFIKGVLYTVTSINNEAFRLKTKIKTVVIPETITKIGNQAFDGCTNLVNIKIPSSVVELGSQAFYGCGSLEEIEIPDSVTTITSLSGSKRSLFHNCANLKKVTLGKGVRVLPYQCFYNCPKLTDVVIKGKIHTVMNQLFSANATTTVWTDESQVDTLKNLFILMGSANYPNVAIKPYRDLIGINEYINNSAL